MEEQVPILRMHPLQLFPAVRKLRLINLTWLTNCSCICFILDIATAPYAPRYVVAWLMRPLLVRVTWSPPSVTNGVITQYRVYATPVAQVSQRKKRQILSADVIEKVS